MPVALQAHGDPPQRRQLSFGTVDPDALFATAPRHMRCTPSKRIFRAKQRMGEVKRSELKSMRVRGATHLKAGEARAPPFKLRNAAEHTLSGAIGMRGRLRRRPELTRAFAWRRASGLTNDARATRA